MDHSISIAGVAFGLRPVAVSDAAFIVQLRTGNPHKTRFVHATSPSVDDQIRWLEGYLARPDDYYFVIHRLSDGRAEGVLGIYDVDHVASRAEWGRWVLRDGSLASVESLLLIYRAAFDALGLAELYSDTNAENQAVVSFHDSAGIRKVSVIENRFVLNDRPVHAVRHACTRAEWPTLEAHLLSLAAPIARRVARL